MFSYAIFHILLTQIGNIRIERGFRVHAVEYLLS